MLTENGSLLFVILLYIFKAWFIFPEGTAVNQPAYPYASYSTQASNPVTNLYPVGNYPTQYPSGNYQQPQYQYQYKPQLNLLPVRTWKGAFCSFLLLVMTQRNSDSLSHFVCKNDWKLNLPKCKEVFFYYCYIYLCRLFLCLARVYFFLSLLNNE